MDFLVNGEQMHLRMAWWIDDEPDEEREEQERTTIKKRLFLETLEHLGGRITMTAKQSDISRATYYHWIKTDPTFKEAVDEVLTGRGTIIRDVLMTKALSGDVRALKYLDAKYNKEPSVTSSEVHIYHHVDKKEEPVLRRTLEDLINEQAEKRRKLAEEGHMPHLVQKEEDSKRKDENNEKPIPPWED